MKNLLLFIVLIFINNLCSAQIIYHKFDPPNSTIVYESEGDTTKFFFLDINNDSVTDFRFSISYWYYFVTPLHDQAFSSRVYSDNESKIGILNTTYPCNALFLDETDTISSELTWNTNARIMYHVTGNVSCAPSGSINYLPIELKLNNYTHYGWILLKTIGDEGGYGPYAWASLKIYDFAFNSVPGAGLITGDTLTSLSPAIVVRIFPNPVVQNVNIESSVLFTQIQLIDIYGNILIDIQNNVKERSIDCSNIKSGFYFLKFYNNNFFVIRKIIKKQ